MHHQFDVLTVTDCRLPGGTASSAAEEINAQSRTGLRSGLLHVDSSLVGRTRPFNSRLRDQLERRHATLVLPTDRVTCDLVVIRHPRVASSIDVQRTPPTRAERCIVVINQVPVVDGREVYEFGEAGDAVEEWLGVRPLWAPIGPLVREAVRASSIDLALEDDDWVNVIDVDEWSSDRPRRRGHPIIVGRHSRDHHVKFPDSRQSLLAAYPDRDDFEFRLLGGRQRVAQILGSHFPSNWVVHEFDSVEPKRFLSELDVYSYFHHPRLIEAFGRNMLEAMANGVPVVTHGHFSQLFGEAIVPSDPSRAPDAIRSLVDDRGRYDEQVERARSLVAERFAYSTHVARIEKALGRSTPRTSRRGMETPSFSPTRPTALFIGPNGSGLGHLTRLMALAGRGADRWNPVFLSFSTAVDTVREQGFEVDYVPSRAVSGSPSVAWHRALAQRLDDLIASRRPSVVVIDSTEPYRGILRCLRDHPEIPVVWSRRGMWKPGVSNAVLDSGSDFFDLVIEPGDLARSADRGATVDCRTAEIHRPVTLLDRDDLAPRKVARDELGLAEDEFAVLVQLGAGNINDTTAVAKAVVDGLVDRPSARLFFVKTPISSNETTNEASMSVLETYPLARIMRAFDMAVAASGYNTFHELMAAGVPSVLVPNRVTITDDQVARAEWAQANGLAIVPESDDPHDVALAVKWMLDDVNRQSVVKSLDALPWMSGTASAVESIVGVARTATTDIEARRSRRAAAYAAIEESVESRAARKRSRVEARRRRRHRSRPAALARGLGNRVVKKLKHRAIARLGRHRLLALHSLLPGRWQRRLQRWTNLAPGRSFDDPDVLRVPPGLLLGAVDEAALARVLVVIGDEIPNDAVVEAVARLQTTMRNFAPFFLTRSLAADAFRRFGYLWECEPSTEMSGPSRLDRVLGWYRPDLVVEVKDIAMVEDPRSSLQSWLRAMPTV